MDPGCLRNPGKKDFSHRSRAAEPWLASRVKRHVLEKWDKTQWSTVHKRLDARKNTSEWDVYESEADVKEFMKWSLKHTRKFPSARQFLVAYMERPWWRADGLQWPSSFAAEDFQHGDFILDLHTHFCLSDIWMVGDPASLHSDSVPWEVQLASKLLRERSKGRHSQWASFIKLLPTFIPLPLFFSELEMNNIQDRDLQDEVKLMRNFAKSTFQALQDDEIASAKFGDYVWSLSVVYSLVCQVDEVKGGYSSPITSHYLMPFFSSDSGDNGHVYAEYVNDGLRLGVYDVKEGMPLVAEYAIGNLRDTFLFRGFVPSLSQQNKIRVFSDVLDLVNWYSSAHSGVNHNRYLTLKLAQDAIDTLSAHLQEPDASPVKGSNSSNTDFSVGADGYVDKYMISIFATLSYSNFMISEDIETGVFTSVDLVVKNGTTPWEGTMKAIAQETVSRYGGHRLDCKTVQDSIFETAFLAAKFLVQERLGSFLQVFSTDSLEDRYLLDAAAWEGMNELEEDQLPCPTCRWQTEQMSYHDNLAVQFRYSVKTIILYVISEISCHATINMSTPQNEVKTQNAPKNDNLLQEFLNWCREHNLIISGQLAITEIPFPAGDQTPVSSKYRGVVAVEDIYQGETLCTIPMSVGLFNNDSRSTNEVDTWDLAAARLIREKAKGRKSAYAPYIAILPDYLPTPIHLEALEVDEVQWLPVMRELVQVRKAIRESYEKLSGEDLAWANFSDYKWAVTMVHSRAFTLPVRGDDLYEQYVLMPFMDMINHHYHYQADWMSEVIWDSTLKIVAKRTVKKGEELFASFGPRSNDNLFLYYGFVLENNPFDSVALFGSFEEALKWFLKLWTDDCNNSSQNYVDESLCRQRNWQLYWSRTKVLMEDIEQGVTAAGKEWAEMFNNWADLGFQFLPYQPGPTIYPNGVIDPSFLAAFSTFYDIIDNVTKEMGLDSPGSDPCKECGSNSALGSSAIRRFFACIESQGAPPRGLLEGHICQSSLVEVLASEQMLTKATLLARISVALRCSEILASFKTTIEQDKKLLNSSRSVDDCKKDNSLPCRPPEKPSRHLELTWHYRYLKKLLLKAPIEQLLN